MATDKNIKKITVNPLAIKRLKVLFRILAHSKKVSILEVIAAADKSKGICVQDIYEHKRIGLGQSHASIMLSELRKEKLVITRREGKKIFYTINQATIDAALEIGKIAEQNGLI